jgi:hypothetical protein
MPQNALPDNASWEQGFSPSPPANVCSVAMVEKVLRTVKSPPLVLMLKRVP